MKLARRWRHLKSIVAKIEADPNAKAYQDDALIPVGEEDSEHMELYTQSETVRAAVKHERRVAGGPANGHQPKVHAGNGHAANGHKDNGLGDAAHHDAGHHDHAHERRPDIAPPAA